MTRRLVQLLALTAAMACGGNDHLVGADAQDGGTNCPDGDCLDPCPAGQTRCAGVCVALDSSPDHCGSCGAACDEGEACVAGQCTPLCPAGTTRCGSSCRDLRTDRAHCGECDHACLPDEVCAAGSCTLHCPSGTGDCGGVCRDLQSDRDHCGACGKACGPDQECVSGSCALTCTGFASDACSGFCTNLKLDPRHCGACGVACPEGLACLDGVCGDPAGCLPPKAFCDSACTLPDVDPAHCGSCGQRCPALAHARSFCSGGQCTAACLEPYADCDHDLSLPGSNGCESHLPSAFNHCGACGHSCQADHAATVCQAGACVLLQCDSGFADCDEDAATGCEVDLSAVRRHCGACNKACAPAESCIGGVCEVSGEDCGTWIGLTRGENRIAWNASQLDYLTESAACGLPGETPIAPDLVMRWDATASGAVQLLFRKPSAQRWQLVVSEQCGDVSTSAPSFVCARGQVGATSLIASIDAVAGKSYFLHLVNARDASGIAPPPLENPFFLKVVAPLDCATDAPRAEPVSPAPGSVVATLRPTVVVNVDAPLSISKGAFLLSGSLGASMRFEVGAPEVAFSEGDTLVTVSPNADFAVGQTITVGWEGVEDAACGKALPTLAWSFEIPSPACTPGAGGMVGNSTQTRVSTGLSSMTEYYVAADDKPDGYVYVGSDGGTSADRYLYRVRKTGGAAENVYALAGLGGYEVGSAMVIDGDAIYTVENIEMARANQLWRLSADGGQTWAPQNVIAFPSDPSGAFYGAAAHGGRVYLISRAMTSGDPTQIWSVNPSAPTLPDTARLEQSFGVGVWGYCSGLAVDASHFYTMCYDRRTSGSAQASVVLAVDRATGEITELTRAFSGASTAGPNAVHAQDLNADGRADVLYLQTGRREVYYVCLGGRLPWADGFVVFNPSSSTTNYGLAYDRALNALWVFDDSNREFVRIQ